uniref:transposase n=1 Tax=Parasutterella excrementihominis TaxID=487175 RepID=UPI003FF0D563
MCFQSQSSLDLRSSLQTKSYFILERLKEVFSEVCRRDRVNLLECSGEEDHVHLLISYPPTIWCAN